MRLKFEYLNCLFCSLFKITGVQIAPVRYIQTLPMPSDAWEQRVFVADGGKFSLTALPLGATLDSHVTAHDHLGALFLLELIRFNCAPIFKATDSIRPYSPTACARTASTSRKRSSARSPPRSMRPARCRPTPPSRATLFWRCLLF